MWRLMLGVMLMCSGGIYGQDYPTKPIRILASVPGGGGDFVARLIAQGLAGSLGQQVIVDNRGGIIGIEAVAKAPPDGYTILAFVNNFWLMPFMQNVSYDPVKDFAPVTLSAISPNILVVHPSLPVKSVKELIALAKARPGELNYASAATGSSSHLAAELFKAMARVQMVRIPYKGAGPALSDLIGGQVQMTFAAAGGVVPHVKSNRLRALAVTSAKPSLMLPGLPTVAASGLPGYEMVTIYAVWAPAKTPTRIISRLNQDIVRVVNRDDVKEKLLNAGIEVVGSSPEEFASMMHADMIRMGKVIKDAGIRDE